MSKDFEYLTMCYFTCVTPPVTIHEAFCTGNINKSQTTSEHDWRRGWQRRSVCEPRGILMCVLGCVGCVLFGYVRAPRGPILNFIHSFIHGTGMSSHHQQAHRLYTCTMRLAMPFVAWWATCRCVPAERAALAHCGAVTDFNLTGRYWTLDSYVWDVQQDTLLK